MERENDVSGTKRIKNLNNIITLIDELTVRGRRATAADRLDGDPGGGTGEQVLNRGIVISERDEVRG